MWFILLLLLPGVQAKESSGWDDFTDNLATDLAPLITLFGERLTKQFLSESISILDNFIFALAPLGILTAVVSVIRVCGNPSLRAFVGRAQEGPGEAERELLSCVSETTAEVFNDGGDSRVFGRPQILEVVVWEDQSPKEGRRSLRMGTLRDALHEGAWYREGDQGEQADEQEYPPALDIPNLSLNTGIKRRRQGWFYVAACLGCVLQAGVVFYSALTVFLYPANFKKDGKPVAGYAFPLFLLGTILLCTGMFLCAFIIERSSVECYLRPNKPSKIYWLQPGGQHVGDQVFGPFLDANECRHSEATTDIRYIKSTRHQRLKVNDLWLLSTVSLTIAGWVIQFVGLRGLHASVVLAQMGSTILMAIIRTWLRTKRIGSDDSQFTQEECRLTAHKKQELDCFAFRLEGVESFNLRTTFGNELSRVPPNNSSATTGAAESDASVGPGVRLVQTRARLAELTSDIDPSENRTWLDLPIRKTAHILADTIGRTMDCLSTMGVMKYGFGHFTLVLECNQGVASPALETLTIKPQQSENTLRWRVNETELEAVLGLWTWSLLKSSEDWLQLGLGRLVGLHESEAEAEEKNLYFHKWVFRQTEADIVSSSMINSSRQLFGFYSNTYPGNMDTLVVRTQNGLETMAAQDIYIHFLNSVLGDVNVRTEVKVDFSPQSGFSAYSGCLDKLVGCFVSGDLGSREDGLLCIVPVLRRKNLLPDLAADSASVRKHVDDNTAGDHWQYAFSLVRWLCERCEGPEFERSVFELGRLCHRAMLHNDPNVQQEGYHECNMILQSHSRADYLRRLNNPRIAGWVDSQKQREWWKSFSMQFRWVTWNLASKRPNTGPIKAILESIGPIQCLSYAGMSQSESQTATDALLRCLTFVGKGQFPLVDHHFLPNEDQLCFDWVTRSRSTALCHWISVKWAEAGRGFPEIALTAFVLAAKSQSDSAIETLCRHGLDINACSIYGYTALAKLVDSDDTEASKRIVVHGGDVRRHCRTANFLSNNTPILSMAAINGNEDLMTLLLGYGANIESRDDEGNTALLISAYRNKLKTASFLLKKGANVETVADGTTPLRAAAMHNHHRMVELLLDHGANINARSSVGSTALMVAAEQASTNTARILLDRKADTNLRNSQGKTALDQARESKCTELIALLGACSEQPSIDGQPLHNGRRFLRSARDKPPSQCRTQ